MKTSSCKAKGRRCAAEVREVLLQHEPTLQGDDILITSSGVTGEDLVMSPLARTKYPWAVEAKNVERLNIWQALSQAESNADKYQPILCFKRNRSKLYVAMELSYFLKNFKKQETAA